MKINVFSLSLLFSVIFIVIILELVRRNRMHEKYSLLWLFFSLVMIFFAGSPKILEVVATVLDVKYAPSLLFLVGVVFLILYSLSITIVISKQSERIIKLAQEVAILKGKINTDEKE